ncbi:MAG: DUF3024 domain-containing protein [Verrucomicrobiota bacterium]
MAFTEQETELILTKLEEEFWTHRRPPLPLRDEMREGQRIHEQSIELFLSRPAFRRPDDWIEEAIARIRYVRTRDAWELYWQRADLKWHRYEPCPESQSLSTALAEIHRDEHGCFFG